MDKKQILESLKLAKENSKKRNFSQSVDLVINLIGLNLKKPEENVNTFITLPYDTGKTSKVAALIGDELQNKAKEVCDFVLNKKEFSRYAENQKELKKLTKEADFFIAQANLMTDVAKFFGRVLGPVGKMPNPKTGAVVPSSIPNLKPIVEKLKKTVKLQTKNEQSVKVIVGKENMRDDDLAENILAVYNTVIHSIPDEKQNLRNVIVKLTMGKPFIVGQKPEKKEEKVEEKHDKDMEIKKEPEREGKKIVKKKRETKKK